MRKIELRSMAALLCMNFVVQFVAFPRKSCVAQHADEGQSGIQIEIQLDSQDVLFGDPIYGFVSIKNISGQERFVPEFGGAFVELIFDPRGSSEQVNIGLISCMGAGHIRRRPPAFQSVAPMMLRYSSMQTVETMLDDGALQLTAVTSVPTRPPTQWERDWGIFASEGDSDKRVDAVGRAQVGLRQNDSLFVDPQSKLAQLSRIPQAWRDPTRVPHLRFLKPLPGESDRAPFQLVALLENSIQVLPILTLSPTRADTIRSALNPRSASWRYLGVQELMVSMLHREKSKRPEVEQSLDRLCRLLANSGSAEALLLGSRFLLVTGDIATNTHRELDPEHLGYLRHMRERAEKTLADRFPGARFTDFHWDLRTHPSFSSIADFDPESFATQFRIQAERFLGARTDVPNNEAASSKANQEETVMQGDQADQVE